MNRMAISIILILSALNAHSQCCDSGYTCSVVRLPCEFDKGVQISSLIWRNDTLIMPAEKCRPIFIGHLFTDSFNIKKNRSTTVNYLFSLDTVQQRQGNIESLEGLAFSNGYYYCTDEGKATIFRFDRNFKDTPNGFEIKFRPSDDTSYKDDGFEGIAVASNNRFYILLEKVKKSNPYSVLYIGNLKNDAIEITSKRIINLDSTDRYCDLYYSKSDSTLYFLHTAYYSNKEKNGCNSKNYYKIESLKESDILATKDGKVIKPKLVYDFTSQVLNRCTIYNSNVEGLTKDDKGNFYVVSDNCQCKSDSCGKDGQGKTLLLRISKNR